MRSFNRPPEGSPPLVIEALRKHYRSQGGVDRVDLDVAASEVLALLGPNGSGKTTTLRCAVGLLIADAGVIRVAGQEPGTRAAMETTCFIPDNPDLYPGLTLEEHLRFRSQAFGARAGQAAIDGALEELELSALRDRLGGELSRGQRQRTALAAALLANASLYVLDEPTVGLDPPGVRWLGLWLRQQAERGAGVLVATHSLDFVARVADRVVVVHGGRSRAPQRVPPDEPGRRAWQDQVVVELGALGAHV